MAIGVREVRPGSPPRFRLLVGRPDGMEHCLFDVSLTNDHEAANITEAQARDVVAALLEAYPAILIDLGVLKERRNCGATYPHDWHRGCDGIETSTSLNDHGRLEAQPR